MGEGWDRCFLMMMMMMPRDIPESRVFCAMPFIHLADVNVQYALKNIISSSVYFYSC